MSRAPEQPAYKAIVAAKRGRFFVGEPLFDRSGQIGLARKGPRLTEGELAVVAPAGRGARVVRALGRPDRAEDVLQALLWERIGEPGFAKAIRGEARAAVEAAEGRAPREDLTGEPTFTVDPATARDFDDAVSAERDGDGVRIRVHIADVSAHVRPGSGLDDAARERATSVYVPGSVEPMLPGILSNDACSLVPGERRPAVTTSFSVGPTGKVSGVSFARSVIRSDARLSYDELDRIFAGTERAPDAVAEPIVMARRAAASLAGLRSEGRLVVGGIEPEFVFADGNVVGATSVPQTEAHTLIEHLMVATNEQVAEYLERREVPTLYRVHEQPEPARIEWLVEQLASLDLPTPPLPETISPKAAGEIAARASVLVANEAKRRGHGMEAYTTFVLRALKQAYYSDVNLGHAGLASPAYAHFTSPIRRYPDLIAHRGLLAGIGAGEDVPPGRDVAGLGPHCSDRERRATRVERDADSICLGFLLELELRERSLEARFEGEVSGVIGHGAFVRFRGRHSDTYEGFIPVRKMRDDHFDLNSAETALIGRRTGRQIGIGDQLEVSVSRIDAPRGRVDLLP